MEGRGETEITAPLYDSLKKLDSERKGESVKHIVKADIPPIGYAVAPLTTDEIKANLAAQFHREAGGARTDIPPDVFQKTLVDLTSVIAATRHAIITEFRQAQEIGENGEETRKRLDGLKAQLEAKFVPQVELINERVEAAQDAYKSGDTEALRRINENPLSTTDLQQATFRALETQAKNINDKLPPLKTLAALDQRALKLIREESIDQIMQDPKRTADQKIIADFAAAYLGADEKTGAYEAAMAEARALKIPMRDRLLIYGQLTVLAQLVNGIKGTHQIDATKLVQRTDREMRADPEVQQTITTLEYQQKIVDENKFELPQLVRKNVDYLKLQIFHQQSGDPRLNLLGRILNHGKGKTRHPDEAKAAFQLIRDLQAEGKELRFSPTKLEKEAQALQKKGNVTEKDLKAMGDNKLLYQMAAYELSFVAEKMLIEGDPNTQKNLEALKKIEGRGYETTASLTKEYNYQHAGDVAGKMFSRSGIASGLLVGWGVATTVLNLAYSIQNDDYDNPYILLGLAAAGVGVKGLQTNYIDTLIHPENKTFNELAALINSKRTAIITEIFANKEEQALIRCLDLSKPGANTYKYLMRQEAWQENALKKTLQAGGEAEKKPYRKEKHILNMGSPQYEVSKSELKPGKKELSEGKGEFDWSGIIKEGYEEDAAKAIENLRGNSTRDHWRFQAIKWLYDANITNAEVEKIFVHAKTIRDVQFKSPSVVETKHHS